jgi:hypothetical protein
MCGPEQSSRRYLGSWIELLAVCSEWSQGLDAPRGRQKPMPARVVRPLHCQFDSQWTSMSDTTGEASKTLKLLAFDPQLKAGLPAIRKVCIDSCGDCV